MMRRANKVATQYVRLVSRQTLRCIREIPLPAKLAGISLVFEFQSLAANPFLQQVTFLPITIDRDKLLSAPIAAGTPHGFAQQ